LNNVVQGRTYKVCIRAPYVNGNEQVCKNVKAPTAGKRKTVSFTVDGSLKDLETSSDTTDTLDDGTDPALGSTVACTKDNCPLISKYVNPAIAVLSALVGIVAVIAIVVGGIQVTTSAGDPQKSAAGKNHIRNAVIGVAAYVFLYAFLQWIIPGGSI
jgi:hypothetical protein